MLHLKLCQIVHDLYSYKLLQNRSFKRDWWEVGNGGLPKRKNSCGEVWIFSVIITQCMSYTWTELVNIVLCFLLFQDTTHKAKEKEKGKSPNPVSKMNDLPFLVVYLQRHKSMAVGWKCWSHALSYLWTKILCQAETFSCNRVRWRFFNENYIEPKENGNAN